MSARDLTICVATRDRAASLERFLASLGRALRGETGCEVIVVDNGSSDSTAALLRTWAASGEMRRFLTVPMPGKARSLNAALALASAPVVAFTDDDVEVDAGWAAAILDFFATHPEYAAAMGRVRLPPEEAADPQLQELIDEYRTIPVFDRGDAVCDLDDMYGANMAVRRNALSLIGGFHERLGPGVGTAGEDTDLAQRLLGAGLRLGYMPGAVVYHEVDRRRLTLEYLRDFQVRLGRSELVLHPERSCWRALPPLLESAAIFGWASVTGARRRRTRAWGRLVRHADLFRARWRRELPPSSRT